MKVPEARTHIATLTDPAALQALLDGETRKGVIDAVNERLAELAAAAASGEARLAPPTGIGEASLAPPAADAAADDAPADAPPADDAPAEDAADDAPPLKQGKGNKPKPATTTPLYVLLNPQAKGKLGLKGYLYERSRVVNDQHLLAQLHAAGCRQVKKLK
jgi:hypothetical protein